MKLRRKQGEIKRAQTWRLSRKIDKKGMGFHNVKEGLHDAIFHTN